MSGKAVRTNLTWKTALCWCKFCPRIHGYDSFIWTANLTPWYKCQQLNSSTIKPNQRPAYSSVCFELKTAGTTLQLPFCTRWCLCNHAAGFKSSNLSLGMHFTCICTWTTPQGPYSQEMDPAFWHKVLVTLRKGGSTFCEVFSTFLLGWSKQMSHFHFNLHLPVGRRSCASLELQWEHASDLNLCKSQGLDP